MSRTEHANFLVMMVVIVVISSRANAGPIGLTAAESVSPEALSMLYNSATGELTAFAPEWAPLTALEIRSHSESFSPPCNSSMGLFDVCSSSKLFHLDVSGFASVEFGPVLPPGMRSRDLVQDLRIDGASLGGGFHVGTGPTLSLVAEPHSRLLVLIASTFGFGIRQRLLSRPLTAPAAG